MARYRLHSLRLGCAGWNIPRGAAASFPDSGPHLQRYATQLSAVEINSSFYRPHRPQTYARWAASVPDGFRFSVKVPKQITHELRLRDTAELLTRFMGEVTALGDRFGCLLVQLPPSLEFDEVVAAAFFAYLRQLFQRAVVCEPRHASWFGEPANGLLKRYQVGRVAANPALHPGAGQPAGHVGTTYFRLHGAPQTYYSAYTTEFLRRLAAELAAAQAQCDEIWCIFDNTAAGHAIENALELQGLVAAASRC